ncbi:MAG TPA: excinuclease ABC subunit UvrC [Fibrobacteraceae bacterium]|nr:excinuclease ABC subunit UvrC [Fibrobacteraceae bacterium]
MPIPLSLQEQEHIQKRLSELPARPGVYLMKDIKGRVIYVGKAKLLDRRVRSYFDGREKSGHRAARLMVPYIRDIEWVLCETEQEALILEATFIKKYWPRYNVLLKDDKHFPYLMFTLHESFPRLRVVRQVHDDGNQYFGPFLNSRAMRTLLDLVPRLFHIRECDLPLPLKTPIRPCLAWHIGRCDAPCANKCTPEEYAVQVKEASRLLEGRRDDLLRQWTQQMQTLSAERRFEDAAKLRDRIQALQATATRQKADLSTAGLDLDAVAVCRSGNLGCAVILEYRDGVLVERRHFPLACHLEQEEAEILAEFLPTWYLQEGSAPPEILVEHELEDTEILSRALADKAEHKVKFTAPQRGDKPGYLRLARANAEMLLVELKNRELKYDEIDQSVFVLQKELGLTNTPFRLECFDISHLSGTDTVASMVCFRNGRSARSEYRRFRVKTVAGIDDFASMREIVGRRLQRLLEEGKPLPDLLVIDGGKGQVDAAWAVTRSMGLAELPLIGLAKRLEEIIIPGQAESLLLKRTSPALKLLQRARDEAHRFAITYQRSLRKTHLRVEWLSDIPGVGPSLQTRILKQWKTREAFFAASLEELNLVLGPKRAQIIRDAVQLKTDQKKAAASPIEDPNK